MEKIKIGKIVSASGLKGEVKVYNYSDSPDSYMRVASMFIEDTPYKIQNARTHKNTIILKLEGIDDRDAAERQRGRELYITDADLPPLPEGQFYVRDLIGMEVVDDKGDSLGKVTDVLQNTPQDIFEVERENGKKLLIPKVDQFVLDIDGRKRVIRVRLIEGMLDL